MSPRPRWVFVAVMALCVLGLIRTQRYFGHIYHGWDAQFYYSLAHSLLFDRDFDVTNNLSSTPDAKPFDPNRDGSWSEAPRRADGGIPSKYPLGMSLVEIPFLGVGYLLRRAVAFAGWEVPEAVGYSAIELWCVALGIQLLFSFGLVVLYRLVADDYGKPAALLGVFSCWMGTSLFYYSAIFPFMAHAVSFVLLVLVLHATRALTTDGPTNRRLAFLGLLLAATFLVRPQQAVVALFLLPVLVSVIRAHPPAQWAKGACAGAAACVAAVAAQVAFNYSQLGTVTLSGYSAGGEGFSWLAPRLSEVLLSPSRGLLVFSPVVALAARGYFRFARSVPGYVWPAVGNAVAQVYLIAAWSSPDQGDSFGARMWSDNSATVAVGLALSFHRSGSAGRWLLVVAVLLATCWTMYQLARYVGLLG